MAATTGKGEGRDSGCVVLRALQTEPLHPRSFTRGRTCTFGKASAERGTTSDADVNGKAGGVCPGVTSVKSPVHAASDAVDGLLAREWIVAARPQVTAAAATANKMLSHRAFKTMVRRTVVG